MFGDNIELLKSKPIIVRVYFSHGIYRLIHVNISKHRDSQLSPWALETSMKLEIGQI